MKSLRIGRFAVTVEWYPVYVGFAVQKWHYRHQSSWRHGHAYLGRFRICW